MMAVVTMDEAIVAETADWAIADPRQEFEALYRHEFPGMVKLARAMVDQTDKATEIVQEAFAKTWRKWSTVKNPGGYVRTAVVNGCRSELRKREVRRRIPLPAPDTVDDREREYLADALAQLSPKRRIVLVLRFYEDMPDAEIAEVLGVRPGTIKSLASRGLADLRKVIERD